MDTSTAIVMALPQQMATGEEQLRPRSYVDRKKSYFLFKRITDIIVAIFFIATVLTWLIPVMAILIKLDSRGPVFFSQRRVGRGGRTFTCYKLRTMIINKDSDTQAATECDGRITRIGKILRALNIDEFPQFINVLYGQMSLVGPRPHMHSDCHRFSSHINGYKFRHLVKPGITGLAQVKGFHGPAVSRESILNRFKWDAFYICNAGMLIDIKILAITAIQQMRMLVTGRQVIS